LLISNYEDIYIYATKHTFKYVLISEKENIYAKSDPGQFYIQQNIPLCDFIMFQIYFNHPVCKLSGAPPFPLFYFLLTFGLVAKQVFSYSLAADSAVQIF
jgi:hypothetical protein